MVKEARDEAPQSQFNLFIMGLKEGPQEVHNRLIKIVNSRRVLEIEIINLEVNKSCLRYSIHGMQTFAQT